MKNKLHISSELMEHYRQVSAVSGEKKMQAVCTGAYKGFLSIGEDGALYLTRESGEKESGWKKLKLCEGLRKLHPGGGLSVKTFACAYDEPGKAYALLVAVTVAGKDYIYLSTGGSLDRPEWLEVKQAQGNGNVHQLHISVSGRERYIIVDFMQKDGTVERFYVNSSSQTGKLWDYYPLSADFGEILDTRLGRAVNQRVDGFYTLGLLHGRNQLLYMPACNPYDPGVAPTSVRLQLPDKMDTLAVLPISGTRFTHLLAAGSGQLLLYPYDRQKDSDEPVVIAKSDYFRDVKQLFAYASNGKTYVWALNESKQLVYLHTEGERINAANEWTPVLLSRNDVGYAHIFRDAATSLGAMFGYVSDNSGIAGEESGLTGIWSFSQVQLDTAVGKSKSSPSYITQIVMADENNLLLPDKHISVRASERCCAQVNGKMYYFKDSPLDLTTNQSGEIRIVQAAQNTSAIKWTVCAEGMEEYEIDPSAHVVDKLLELDTADKLQNARCTTKAGSAVPLIPPKTDRQSLEAVAQALQTLKEANRHLEMKRSGRMMRGPAMIGTLEDFAPFPPENGKMPGIRLSVCGGSLSGEPIRLNDESVPEALLVTPFGVTMRSAPKLSLSANDVFSFLHTLYNKAYDIFITVVDDAWSFIVKVGEKFVSFVIDCAEKISECAKEIFNIIKVKIKELIDYLKFIFDMEDVRKIRDVAKKAFNLYMDSFLRTMVQYKPRAEEYIDKLIRMAEKWGDLTPLDRLGGPPLLEMSGGNSYVEKYDVKAKHFSNMLISNIEGGSVAALQPATALDTYLNTLSGVSGEVREVITTLVERIKADLLNENALMSMSFGTILKKLAAIVSVTILDIGRRAVSALFDIIILTMESLMKWLNEPLYIPVVSEFLEFCGVGAFSLLDAACYIPAFAGSVVYKIATGKAMIDDDTYAHIMALGSAQDCGEQPAGEMGRSGPRRSDGSGDWDAYCALKGMSGMVSIIETLTFWMEYSPETGPLGKTLSPVLAALSAAGGFVASEQYSSLDEKIELVSASEMIHLLNAGQNLLLSLGGKVFKEKAELMEKVAAGASGLLSAGCLVIDIICVVDGIELEGVSEQQKKLFYYEEACNLLEDLYCLLDTAMHFMGGASVHSTNLGKSLLVFRFLLSGTSTALKLVIAGGECPRAMADGSGPERRSPGVGGLTPVMA